MSTLIIEFLVEIIHVCINSFKHSNAKWCHRSGSIYRRRWSVTFALDIFNNKWIPSRWDRVAHICVSKLTIIDSDDGLSPGRRQAIIWTNAGILWVGSFSEILVRIHTFSLKKMHWNCRLENGCQCGDLIGNMYSEMILLKLKPYITGADEFMISVWSPVIYNMCEIMITPIFPILRYIFDI